MGKTNIEYLDQTWSPIAMRCTPISEGCANCWHLKMCDRLKANPAVEDFQRLAYSDTKWPYITNRTNDPLRMKKPRRIGVQFMGDLFHEAVPFDFIDRIFAIMGMTQRHTYLLLTKRPDRMAEYLSGSHDRYQSILSVAYSLELVPEDTARPYLQEGGMQLVDFYPHVYFGVTAENQARADERIPTLLQRPAAKHFVSIEPMLGPVDFAHILIDGATSLNALTGNIHHVGYVPRNYPGKSAKLDWVVCGGETGPGARPMHPDWVRSVRDQCQASGTPFFFKGWGDWAPRANEDHEEGKRELIWPDGSLAVRVGKRAAGRLLDGRTWEEFPTTEGSE